MSVSPPDGKPLLIQAAGIVIVHDGKPRRRAGAFKTIAAAHARDAGERARLATDAGQIGVWEWNFITGVMIWSPLMFKLYGLTTGEALIAVGAWPNRLHENDRGRSEQAMRDAIAGKLPYSEEFRVVWDDGSIRHLRDAATVTHDSDGNAMRMVGATWDVTELRVLAVALAEKHELLRVTLDAIVDGVMTTDAAGRVAWMNPVAEQLTGWTKDAAFGKKLPDIFRILDEETRKPAANPVDICLTERRVVGLGQHNILVSRHQDEYGIEGSAAPIRGTASAGLGAVLVFRDVTAQRAINYEMKYRATHDGLTGLLNRSEFEVRLRYILHTANADQKQCALLYIDLDHFKIINDKCGHSAGDLLLKEVAKILTGLVRRSDAVVRLGGDEFAVLLDCCTVEQAASVGQKICDQLDIFQFAHEGQRFRVGASVGVVPVDLRWTETSGIMKAADACCYDAKASGRNRVHVWSDTDQPILAKHPTTQWAAKLTEAVDEDRFILFAQRIQSLQRGSVMESDGVRAEVLLRMVGQDNKLVMPGAFLPMAERLHMTTRIDRWVLGQAIGWMDALPASEMIDMLAVNISGQSLSDTAFQIWAIGRLAEAGPRLCSRLCIEIAEISVAASLTDVIRFVEQVRRTGVRVALDDFGAGASSFGYLKFLQVDYLKIDGQFVRNLVSYSLDQAAVRGFIDVAGVVGSRTIAKSVESSAVMAKLKKMGVNYAQGHLVHKPAPIAELITH